MNDKRGKKKKSFSDKKQDKKYQKSDFSKNEKREKSFYEKKEDKKYEKNTFVKKDEKKNFFYEKKENKKFEKKDTFLKKEKNEKSFSDKKGKEKKSDDTVRLNKFIANSGICSRREADELIASGLVEVNGKVVTEMGFQVKPTDKVTYEKRTLKREKFVYILLNKPKDFITTMDDPQDRKTVMDLVKNACKERVYPVGRLDRNTTGLLLLTNDGELAKKLSHPSHQIKKIYQLDLDKPLHDKDFEKIIEGVELEDGIAKIDELAILSSDSMTLGISLHIGRNRIVRRIFEHLGYEVVKLDRVMYAGLTKKDLGRGKWRMLTEKEVIGLKYFTK